MIAAPPGQKSYTLLAQVSDNEDNHDDKEYEEYKDDEDDSVEILGASSVDSFVDDNEEKNEEKLADITALKKVFLDIDEGFAVQKREREEDRAARNEDKKARPKKRKLAQKAED
ncbi:hypothetical protein CNYM01_00837 [Colletotrichum nymphaeae SA-01]|uniref:Uncharacterized protein n=1 Tax=Colletotrichum nymphaeae SA-01 TaxID=1460502 RepID=A0A135TBH0_9PEZI|nr:hypothetical protein CNYM01_00837 [Colletotrichum nymphaeae SA-01]